MNRIEKLRAELNQALYEMIDASSVTKAQKAEKRIRRCRSELVYAYWMEIDSPEWYVRH